MIFFADPPTITSDCHCLSPAVGGAHTNDPGATMVLPAPPCGTPEAKVAPRCVKWAVSAPLTKDWPTSGYYWPASATEPLPMTAGRCTYTTEFKGRWYADQDFSDGAGGGKPRKGARPC